MKAGRDKRSVKNGGHGGDATKRKRRENALEAGLQDSYPASDPVSVVQPAPSRQASRPHARSRQQSRERRGRGA